MSLKALGIGQNDEVITVANTAIPTVSAIRNTGASVKFIDIREDYLMNYNEIEKAISKKTKAIIPVHLYGHSCEMDKIIKIAKKYKLKVIEDAAQSIGSKLFDRASGSYGDVGCFSAHPLKNLSAIGDAGYIVTDNYKIYKKIKSLSNHGMENRNIIKNFGYVSRMDNIQAAFLNHKLNSLNSIIKARRRNAEIYKKELNRSKVFFIDERSEEFNTYHTFVVQVEKRDKLKKFLLNKNIQTSIHYPIPIHLQPASLKFGYKKGDFKNI